METNANCVFSRQLFTSWTQEVQEYSGPSKLGVLIVLQIPKKPKKWPKKKKKKKNLPARRRIENGAVWEPSLYEYDSTFKIISDESLLLLKTQVIWRNFINVK